MPSISMFYGIVIYMYYEDHCPPHFHAKYQSQEAIYSLDGEVINGGLPAKQHKLVSAWTALHEDELLANWKLAEELEKLYPIEPLR